MLPGTTRFIFCAALCVAAAAAGAQAVYKCGRSGARSYTDRPCSNRIVDTSEARVPVASTPTWTEQDRALARAMRQRRGEPAGQFAVRRHRAGLPAADRAECARLDHRIPLEQARMKAPDAAEISEGAAAFEAARHRFGQLRC